jgi:hypothetical protein
VIEGAHFVQRQTGEDPAMRVDDGGNAGIGGPDQRQTLLDCAQAGLMQMLIRARRCAKPGIIGKVE